MRARLTKTTPPDTLRHPVARANLSQVEAFAHSLAARPVHTRTAYVRDVSVLAAAARDAALGDLTPGDLRRILATLHGRGLSGRSLARMLSSWRAFYQYLQERDAKQKENPCTGLRPPRSARRLPA